MSKALLIGIDEYNGNRLFSCVNDAKAMAELIHRNADGSLNMQVNVQTNVPTKAKLMSHVQEIFSGTTDIAVFYYSGHGYVNNLGGYLVTPDAKAFDEGVRMDDVIQVANASKVLNRIIILDCCHSGAIADHRLQAGLNMNIMEGVTILTASRSDQSAIGTNQYSVFTGLLLLALSGGAADIRGHITPGSVYAYIDQALGEFGQRPVFKTNVTRFISMRKVEPQVSRYTLLKITDYFNDADSEYSLNPSFESTNSPHIEHLVKEPYAAPKNVAIFKDLQQMQSVGLVVPEGAEHMYYAAMESKGCRLTPLGKHYWKLVNEGKAY